ncbi:hypothetical protein [uncultured Aquimarina sp.]|uniref:hypothetical protein n=1 Tax=uncultured Aquimarina sp. TaxID=575652 RepID=UPI00261AD8C1|nr:hypothetical protein [uncultured Aquimarina sp.]
MFSYTKILLVFFTTLVFSARSCVRDTSTSYAKKDVTSSEEKPRPVNADKSTFEENSEITRAVLITHCGSCHQSSLDTHKPEAIKIFDLDMAANWHTSLSVENLPGIADRIKNKPAITSQQKEAIDTFLKLKEWQSKQ